MAKYFELQQAMGTGTAIALIINPVVENGSLRATRVGKLNGFSDDGGFTFIKCEPVDIIAIGNIICTEIKNNPFDE